MYILWEKFIYLSKKNLSFFSATLCYEESQQDEMKIFFYILKHQFSFVRLHYIKKEKKN